MSVRDRLRSRDETGPWRGAYAPYDLVKELCIAIGVIALLAVLLTVLFSSPDDKPSTIAQWSRQQPANFITAAAKELNGTSDTAEYGPPYNHNGEGQHAAFIHLQKWLGVSHPINTAQDFVIGPLKTIPNDPRCRARSLNTGPHRSRHARRGAKRTPSRLKNAKRHSKKRRHPTTQ